MTTPAPVPGRGCNPVVERLIFAIVAMTMAGWMHLAIAPGHFEHAPAHGLFFGIIGAFQVLWVILAAIWLGMTRLRPETATRLSPSGDLPWRLRYLGLALSGGALVLWLMTQGIRAPFATIPEPIDGPTILSKLAELGVTLALLGPIGGVWRFRAQARRMGVTLAAGLAMWVVGLVAEGRLPGLAAEPGPGHIHGFGPDGERIPLPSFTAYVSAAGRLVVSLFQGSDYDWGLPGGFPKPRIPDDNPMTAAKVELGRYLFYDQRLSGNGLQSCASCHRQDLAFSDGLALAVGSTGEAHPRNSMALVNVAYNATLTWAHPELERLEDQIPTPMFGSHPVELGITGHEDEVLDRLRAAEIYEALFREAFPGEIAPIEWENIVKALASFTRALISVDSAYDRFVYQKDSEAMSVSALRGMELFLSEDFECHHCHGGFNFSVASVHVATAFAEKVFHNTGLYDLGDGAYPHDNQGAFEITHLPEDMGKFRPPTLRNVAVTAPYMHDGSIATLEDVLDTYAAGGRHLKDGPYAGDGRRNPFKSGFVPGFPITEQEKQDLLAFLNALTDEAFLTDPRFADPFPIQSSALK